MKELLTEWRKFVALNEKLMLKPGPNGWDKYCELVALKLILRRAALPLAPFDEKCCNQIQFEADETFR